MEPLRMSWVRPFTQHELGVLFPPSGVAGVAFETLKSGWKRTQAERRANPLTTLTYDARHIVSKVLRQSAAAYRTSSPAMDGRIPIWGEGWGGTSGPSYIRPYNNKSWEKLVENITGDRASLAVAALESRETWEMVANRANGLRKAYKALRTGNFRGALKQLGVEPKRKHRSKTKAAANEASGLWLEYWFGWAPTVADVYSAIEVLSDKPFLRRLRISATSGGSLSAGVKTSGSGDYRTAADFSGSCFVKQGGTFWVKNENHLLLNRLGVMNPLSVMWETVPFSFVVDWWSGVGNVIDSWTALAGVGMENTYTVRMVKGQALQNGGNWQKGTWEVLFHGGQMQRIAGLTKPVPTWPKLLNTAKSTTRAATAVSLLQQVFLSK